MSANTGCDAAGTTRTRGALGAARTTAIGASIAFVLAGTALPASTAHTSGNCGAASALGTVTCVYDSPTIRGYALRVPAGVTEVHIDARGAAGGRGGTIISERAAPVGGAGGQVMASFPVTGGDLLTILVGGHG